MTSFGWGRVSGLIFNMDLVGSDRTWSGLVRWDGMGRGKGEEGSVGVVVLVW